MTAEAANPAPQIEDLEEESARLAKTTLRSTLHITPVGNILGDVAGLLGEHLLSLMGMFYSRPVCKRANVVVTELVTNVVENIVDPQSELRFEIEVNEAHLAIEVSNKVSDEQYANVHDRIEVIRQADDVKALLRQTIRERRPKRLKGGLGFMRLSSENKFDLSVRRENDYMTVRAVHRIKELAS